MLPGTIKGVKDLTWSSADEETAGIDKNQLTTKKAGKSKFTAKINGKTISISVVVE